MAKEVYRKIDCTISMVTENAFQFKLEGKAQWVPRSVCQNGHKEFSEGEEVVLLIAEWFCNKEGIE